MSDPVITEEEKDALLDGVETGEVEVHANGSTAYASVREYDFPERCRIVSESYPRLNLLNDQLAVKASRSFEKLFNTDVSMRSTDIDVTPYSAFRFNGRSAVIEFRMGGLEGSALIVLGASLMAQLVEAFFGGSRDNPLRVAETGFTPGELKVASLFGRAFVKALEEAWSSFETLETKVSAVREESEMAEILDPTEHLLVCGFEIEFLADPEAVRLIFPKSLLGPLLPALEGQRRERDPAEDARWQRVLRASVTNAVVQVTSITGEVRLALRDIVDLEPGDVINIDDPRKGQLLAAGVPVLAGRFGVHDGCYAMEASTWLTPVSGPHQEKTTDG